MRKTLARVCADFAGAPFVHSLKHAEWWECKMSEQRMSRAEARGVRYSRELEGHVGWLETFSGTALGVLSVASGIYTYLGVSSLLEDNGAMTVFAAIAYSIAVSVGIFVFWSYMLRLFPAVRSSGARAGLLRGDGRRIARHRGDVVVAERRGARRIGGGGAAPRRDRAGLPDERSNARTRSRCRARRSSATSRGCGNRSRTCRSRRPRDRSRGSPGAVRSFAC